MSLGRWVGTASVLAVSILLTGSAHAGMQSEDVASIIDRAIAASPTDDPDLLEHEVMRVPGKVTLGSTLSHGASILMSYGQKVAISVPGHKAKLEKAGDYGTQVAEDLGVRTEHGSVELLSVIRERSEDTIEYRLDISEDIVAEMSPDGGVLLSSRSNDRTHYGLIEEPWAVDARGRSVPTSYSLDGAILRQHVETKNAALPIVADPKVTAGIVTGTVYFNKTETRTMSKGLPYVYTVCASIAKFGVPGAVLGVACAAGNTALLVQAHRAVKKNMCVKFKYARVPALVGYASWPDIYRGGFCK